MLEKIVICLNYRHFEEKIEISDCISNHYLNQVLGVHPLE